VPRLTSMGKESAAKPPGKKAFFGTTKGAFGKEGKGGKRKTGGKPLAKGVSVVLHRNSTFSLFRHPRWICATAAD